MAAMVFVGTLAALTPPSRAQQSDNVAGQNTVAAVGVAIGAVGAAIFIVAILIKCIRCPQASRQPTGDVELGRVGTVPSAAQLAATCPASAPPQLGREPPMAPGPGQLGFSKPD